MLTLSDKVIVRTFSGLGNQLFQLATGLQQSNRLSAKLICDRSENGGFSDRDYALNRIEDLCGFESAVDIGAAPDLCALTEFREKKEFQFDPFINKISLGDSSLWIEDNPATRKNRAGIGYTYDKDKDCFIPPKIFNSWILNQTTMRYEPPVPVPNDGKKYTWNEALQQWEP